MSITIGDKTLAGIAPLVQQAIGGAPPQPEPAPVAPPPPPAPTPAQAGFQAYASDPSNLQRSQHAITEPGQSVLPPPPPQPPPAYAPIQTSMGATPDLSAVAPIGTNPLPNVTQAPPSTFQQWSDANPSQLAHQNWKHEAGSGWKGALKDGAGILTAGLAGAAGGLNHDPSAGLRFVQQMQDYDNQVPDINQDRYRKQVVQPQLDAAAIGVKNATVADKTAGAGLKDAKTNAIPADQQLKNAQRLATLAKSGLKEVTDEDGHTSIVADRENPVFKHMQVLDEAKQAGEELTAANAALARAKNDPNSPAFKLAQERLKVARQNAAAAGTRAQAYMGNYLQHAIGIGLDGKPLAGSTVISDEDGNETLVGSTNAGAAAKAQKNVSGFNDVHGALDTLESSARNLAATTGGKLNTPGVIAAMADAKEHGGLGRAWLTSYLRGANASNLTPQERDYVTNAASMHENIGFLRSAGATDMQIKNLTDMLPNATTPDLDYFNRQVRQLRATADRIGQGAVRVTGGLKVRHSASQGSASASGGGNVAPEGTRVKMQNGSFQVKRGGKWVAE